MLYGRYFYWQRVFIVNKNMLSVVFDRNLQQYVASIHGVQMLPIPTRRSDNAATPIDPNAQRFDPYKNFKFHLKWEGKVVAGANKASGLPPSLHTAAQPAAAGPPPNLNKYEPITLESGVTHDSAFQTWANQTRNPQKNSQSLVLESYDESGRKLPTWNLRNCRVSEFEALPDPDAGAHACSIQRLVLQTED
jgi:phage tail-like protein